MSLSKYVVYIDFCEQEHLSFSKRNFHILPNSKTTAIVKSDIKLNTDKLEEDSVQP